MVGARGFEPPTCCTQNSCATRLRYTPILDTEQEARFLPLSFRHRKPAFIKIDAEQHFIVQDRKDSETPDAAPALNTKKHDTRPRVLANRNGCRAKIIIRNCNNRGSG